MLSHPIAVKTLTLESKTVQLIVAQDEKSGDQHPGTECWCKIYTVVVEMFWYRTKWGTDQSMLPSLETQQRLGENIWQHLKRLMIIFTVDYYQKIRKWWKMLNVSERPTWPPQMSCVVHDTKIFHLLSQKKHSPFRNRWWFIYKADWVNFHCVPFVPFCIDSLDTCNRADQSFSLKNNGWTLSSQIQMYESENGSLKRKEEWSSHHNVRLKKKKSSSPHFTLPLTLLFPSLSLCGSDLRSAVCFPGERQRELSLHLSLSLVIPPPSTLPPLLTPSLSLSLFLSPSPRDLGLSPPVRCPSPSLTPALSLSNCQMKFWENFKCLKRLKC